MTVKLISSEQIWKGKTMSIDNNKEASNMASRFIKEVENRIRSAYNYGFRDGVKQGKTEAIECIVRYSMDKHTESEK